MILEVPFCDFVATLKEYGGDHAYVRVHESECVITGLFPKGDRVLVSYSDQPKQEILDLLKKADVTAREGGWEVPERNIKIENLPANYYVGVVAYKSDEPMPGVWVDTFPYRPTTMQVLNAIYEEFRATGEIGNVAFDYFVKVAHPNVLVLSHEELNQFCQAKPSIETSTSNLEQIAGTTSNRIRPSDTSLEQKS